jgi:hypothetical protein
LARSAPIRSEATRHPVKTGWRVASGKWWYHCRVGFDSSPGVRFRPPRLSREGGGASSQHAHDGAFGEQLYFSTIWTFISILS